MLITLALITLAADTASSNAPAWWMFSGQMIFNIIATLGMFWLKRKTDETDKLRTQVESREATIRMTTERIVTERMGVMMQAIERIEKRLEAGDKRFHDLNAHDHKAEMQLVHTVEELRRYVVEKCATSQDQRELHKDIEGLKLAVARLQEAA